MRPVHTLTLVHTTTLSVSESVRSGQAVVLAQCLTPPVGFCRRLFVRALGGKEVHSMYTRMLVVFSL